MNNWKNNIEDIYMVVKDKNNYVFNIEDIKIRKKVLTGLNTITPVLVCNSDDYGTFKTSTGKAVTNADMIIDLAK